MNFEKQVRTLSERYFTKKDDVMNTLIKARMKPYIRNQPDFNHKAYYLTERYLRYNLFRSVSEE